MTPPNDHTIPAPRGKNGTTVTPASHSSTGEGTIVQHQIPTHFQSAAPVSVPGYAVSREIARGGMGVVYAAHDPAFDREVAIKVMHPGQDSGRFVVESQVTAQLPHPGIPPVYALGALPDGRPFLAMKLITGRTLAELLTSQQRGDAYCSPELLGIFEHICQTVGYAHSRGIIHRDLKPANVMVGAFGEVLVMDWGLAKQVGSAQEVGDEGANSFVAPQKATSETVAGQVKGTPAYMAPEQARGEPVDTRADVFALGGLLAVMLTGKPPFLGNTVLDTVLMAAQAELGECLAQLNGCGCDAELIALAKRCLAPSAEDRYADGQEVAAAVAAYRAGVAERLWQSECDHAAAVARATEQRKKRRVQLALAASVLFMIFGSGAVAWWQDRQATERRVKADREEAARLAKEERDEAERKAKADREEAARLAKEELDEANRKAERERTEADRKATEARLAGERDTERRFKAEQARQGVRANRALADELRRQYKFKAADAALVQAAVLAKGGAPELLAEVERARGELAFVVQLDDIRFRKWVWVADGGTKGRGNFNTALAPGEYRLAFADRDLDLMKLDPNEAAKRIAVSTVKADLVAAVEDWALYEPDATVRDRLLEIARKADPGPWTDRLRDPAVLRNKAAIAKLAEDADPTTASSAALSVLAKLMERNRLDPAPLLLAARASHPTNFELAFALGLWEGRKKSGGQIGPYEAARALRPENLSAWINLGNALREAGDVDGALATYRGAIKLDSKRALAHYNLGFALHESGDVDGAIAAYKEAIKQDPKYAPAHTNLGFTLYKKGDVAGAIAAYKEGIKQDPKYALAHYNLGNTLYEKKDVSGAIASYREAVKHDPQFAAAHTNLGNALKGEGDAAGAIAAYKEAIKQDPDYAAARIGLGDVLREKGDVAGAIAAYKEAIKHNPKDAIAHNNLGLALNSKGDADGAIASYREAVKHDPKFAIAHTNLGNGLKNKGDVEGAIASYKEAIKQDPKYVIAYNNLGIALKCKGDLEGAIAAYKDALKQDPNYAIAHNNLGAIYLQQKKYPEAIDCARAAIKADPKYPTAYGLLGQLLQLTGDIPGARAALTEAARLDPKRWGPMLAKLPP